MTRALIASVLLISLVSACGPAAEDRNAMHHRAKIFQDSIANAIKAQLAEAEGPAAYQYQLEDPNAKKTNTAAPQGGK